MIQASLSGVMETTVPEPSTWPCIMWPPSLELRVKGLSRLTGAPGSRTPRLVRRRVSGMTSKERQSSEMSVMVRQVPLTGDTITDAGVVQDGRSGDGQPRTVH